jgi:hypothetical protein
VEIVFPAADDGGPGLDLLLPHLAGGVVPAVLGPTVPVELLELAGGAVVGRGDDGLTADGEGVHLGEGIAAVDSLDARDEVVDAAAGGDVAGRIGHGEQPSAAIVMELA